MDEDGLLNQEVSKRLWGDLLAHHQDECVTAPSTSSMLETKRSVSRVAPEGRWLRYFLFEAVLVFLVRRSAVPKHDILASKRGHGLPSEE